MAFLSFFKRTPSLRVLVPFAVGIVLQLQFGLAESLGVMVLSVLLIAFWVMPNFRFTYRYRWLVGIALYFALMSMGVMRTMLAKSEGLSQQWLNEEATVIATVTEPLQAKSKSIKTVVKLHELTIADSTSYPEQLCLLYLQTDSAAKALKQGQLVVFKCKLRAVANSGNPNEFDYAGYLQRNHIHQQAYCRTDQWRNLGEGHLPYLQRLAIGARGWVLDVYREYGFAGQEYAVLSALTIGYKVDLADETKYAFSVSGGMHVLAVSGLHVGVIYVLLQFLLKGFDRTMGQKLVALFIMLAALWFYALLTGLAPSVCRAATMMSFLSIGRTFNRNAGAYNSLAASAVLLLGIDPFLIKEVGFQLSYLAVLSILFFQPRIYALLYVPNSALDKIWILISLSLAAQLGTVPISVYYFHQFPNYFLLTNVLVVPLAGFIIYGAVLLLLSSAVPIFAKIVAWVLMHLVESLNGSAHFVERLPGALTDNLVLSASQSLLAYVLLFSIGLYVVNRTYKALLSVLITVLLLSLSSFMYHLQRASTYYCAVYNAGKLPTLAFKHGSQGYVFTDVHGLRNTPSLKFAAQNHWWSTGAKQVVFCRLSDPVPQWNPLLKEGVLYEFCGKRIAYLHDEEFLKRYTTQKITVDYVVLSGNLSCRIDEIGTYFSCPNYVLDGTSPIWKVKRWMNDCKALGYTVHDIKTQGAFVLENFN